MKQKRLMRNIMIGLALLAVAGCGGDSDGGDVCEVAEGFGRAYFNYDFDSAKKYCTAESERWLRFAASNVYEADVEALRAMENGAEVETDDYETTTDTTATVWLTVSGFLERDTIGHAGHVSDKGRFAVPMVRRGETWKVRMAGLPRNER